MKHPKRMEAASRWAALANGTYDPETLAWVSKVARAVLEASRLPDANKRRPAMVRAVQLDGRMVNGDQEVIRYFVTYVNSLTELSPQARRVMLHDLVCIGLNTALSPETIDARIRRAMED